MFIKYFRFFKSNKVHVLRVDVYTNEPADSDNPLYKTHTGCYAYEDNIIRLFNTYFENINNFRHIWLSAQQMTYQQFMNHIKKSKFIIKCPMCQDKNKDNTDIIINDVIKRLPNKDKIKFDNLKNIIIREWIKKKYDVIDCIKCSSLSKRSMLNMYECISPKCKCTFCCVCNIPYNENEFSHNGLSCMKAKILNTQDVSELKLLANSIKCPKCKFLSQRISGCNQMTCVKCKTLYCYECGDYWSCHTHHNHNSCNNSEGIAKIKQEQNELNEIINNFNQLKRT